MHRANLFGLQLQRPLITATEEAAPDPVALPFRIKAAKALQWNIHNPQLFGQLAPSGALHLLTGGDHATGAGIQHAGAEILAEGAPLHQDPIRVVEHQNIAGAMAEILPPHLGSLGHANHPVIPVHHINPFHAQALLFVPFKPAVYRCGGLSWHNFFDDAVNLPNSLAK